MVVHCNIGQESWHGPSLPESDMALTDLPFWIGFLQIVWIDLVLSGDNAVVIALACRGVPREKQRLAILLGAGAAVALRVVLAVFVFELLSLPYIKLCGGLLLLWVALQVGQPTRNRDGQADAAAEPAVSLSRAVRAILIADAVMSLDNVVAIAGAARGSIVLLAVGIAFSIPLVISGSALMLKLIERFPVVVQLGAALIGWVAGDMIAAESALKPWLDVQLPAAAVLFPLIGIAAALLGGRWLGRKGRGSKS